MTSAGVYRILIGNIGVSAGVVSIEGEKRRIPRPLVGVHSGKRATLRLGFSARRVPSGTSFAFAGGRVSGGEKARMRAEGRERRSRSEVVGYEAVKMGSKLIGGWGD